MKPFLLILLLTLLASPAVQAQAKLPFPVVERPDIPCEPNGKPVADYRIAKDHPAIYISFEGTGPAMNPLDAHLLETGDSRLSQRPGRDYWLRLHNNSVWAISLRTYGTATASPPEMIALPNGSFAFAVGDGMEVALAFGLRHADGRTIPVNPGLDFFSISMLPPGRSLLFSVPRKALGKDRVVVVDYEYEWEQEGASGPIHRVELWSDSFRGDR